MQLAYNLFSCVIGLKSSGCYCSWNVNGAYCDASKHSIVQTRFVKRLQGTYTAFLGTRSRAAFDAELAAEAIAAQILTSVPTSLPFARRLSEDPDTQGHKRICTGINEDGEKVLEQKGSTGSKENGSGSASAEMSPKQAAIAEFAHRS